MSTYKAVAHTRKGSPIHTSGPYLETEDVDEVIEFFRRYRFEYENVVIWVAPPVVLTGCTSSVTGRCDCARCREIDGRD